MDIQLGEPVRTWDFVQHRFILSKVTEIGQNVWVTYDEPVAYPNSPGIWLAYGAHPRTFERAGDGVLQHPTQEYIDSRDQIKYPTKKELTIYFAAPLFTEAERMWNRDMVRMMEHRGLKVFLPQQECLGITRPELIAAKCVEGLEKSHAVLSVLEGPDADSGTSWECGYATARGKPVFGLRTDFRNSGDNPATGVNLMLTHRASGMYRDTDEVIDALVKWKESY